MAQRSSVETDQAIRTAVDEAIKRGCTIDAITKMIEAMGAEISRSAVGRYTKKYRSLAERQRDIRQVADSFAQEFGSGDDNQTRLMIQSLTTLITQSLLPQLTGEREKKLDPMALRLLAAAVKDSTSALKIDDDRRRAIRKEAFQQAGEAVEEAGKRAGASPETIRMIKAEIMGLDP